MQLKILQKKNIAVHRHINSCTTTIVHSNVDSPCKADARPTRRTERSTSRSKTSRHGRGRGRRHVNATAQTSTKGIAETRQRCRPTRAKARGKSCVFVRCRRLFACSRCSWSVTTDVFLSRLLANKHKQTYNHSVNRRKLRKLFNGTDS